MQDVSDHGYEDAGVVDEVSIDGDDLVIRLSGVCRTFGSGDRPEATGKTEVRCAIDRIDALAVRPDGTIVIEPVDAYDCVYIRPL